MFSRQLHGVYACHTIEERLTRGVHRPGDQLARDDLRTRSEAADLPQGVRGGKGRERREDGADDHPQMNSAANSRVCAEATRAQSRRGAAASGCAHIWRGPLAWPAKSANDSRTALTRIHSGTCRLSRLRLLNRA